MRKSSNVLSETNRVLLPRIPLRGSAVRLCWLHRSNVLAVVADIIEEPGAGGGRGPGCCITRPSRKRGNEEKIGQAKG
eukprot:1058093-Amphidinium_carterae.1